MKKIIYLLFLIIPLTFNGQNLDEFNGVSLTNLSEVDGVAIANIAEINGVPVVTSTLKEGLYALWEFDETSGTVANDAHSTFDGTNSGVTVNATGLIDKCYFFNSVRANITASVTLSGQDSFSISTWIKTASTADFSGIVPFRQDGGVYSGISLKASGEIYAYNYTSGSANIISTVNIINSNWHHVVLTYASDSLRLYIDGVQDGAAAQTGNTNNSANVKIGYDDVLTSRYYSGYLDQTGVWTKRLTNTEISQLYNSGNGLPYTSFGLWWLILLIRVKKQENYYSMAG